MKIEVKTIEMAGTHQLMLTFPPGVLHDEILAWKAKNRAALEICRSKVSCSVTTFNYSPNVN